MSIANRASRWLSAVLAVALVGCGGGGGGGAGTPDSAGSKIFVGDNGHGAIGSAANSNPSAGSGIVDHVITGGGTLLTAGALGVRDFALDATNDRLFVSDSNRILAFSNVSTAAGNIAPRVLATAAGGDTFAGIYLDAVTNRLYAVVRLSPSGNEIRVYETASSATNATPSRTFSFTCDFMFDIAVNTTLDVAYVYYVTTGIAHVAVLSGAHLLSTALTPTQTIDFASSPGSNAAPGIFLDTANDRLYVPNITGGTNATVEVYEGASGASGTGTQSRTIALVGVNNYTNVFVETSGNRLYAADPTSVTIVANAGASTTTSSLGGVRVLAPPGATFTAVAVKP